MSRFFVTFVGFVLVTAVLYAASAVLIPVALAVLLAFLLTPPVRALERRLPHWLAVGVVVILTFSTLGATAWILTREVANLTDELPRYRHNIRQRAAQLRLASRGGTIGKLQSTAEDVAKELGQGSGAPPARAQAVPVRDERPHLWSLPATLRPFLEGLVTTGLVIALTVFMLARRQELRGRLFWLIGESRLPVATRAVDEAAGRVSQYLVSLATVNAGFGIAVGLGLAMIGVPYAVLWGVLAAALRFIPYVGVWLAALLPITLSFAVFPGWVKPLLVIALFAVLEPLIFLVVEPLVYAHTVGVSAVALLVAVAFWTWLWGGVGLVLSVPLTVCLVVLGKHIPGLGFLAILMDEETAMSPALMYYQRLLAADADEATEIAEDFRRAHGDEALFERVLLVALSSARRDRASGRIDADDEAMVVRVTREVVEASPEPAPSEGEPAVAAAGAPPVRVLGCAARDETDDVALLMLARVLDARRWRLEIASAELLSSEVLRLVEDGGSVLLCVGAVAPGGLAHTRYLVKRLRARFADVRIVATRWGVRGPEERSLDPLVEAGADAVATSLAEARDRLSALGPVTRPAAPVTVPAHAG